MCVRARVPFSDKEGGINGAFQCKKSSFLSQISPPKIYIKKTQNYIVSYFFDVYKSPVLVAGFTDFVKILYIDCVVEGPVRRRMTDGTSFFE